MSKKKGKGKRKEDRLFYNHDDEDHPWNELHTWQILLGLFLIGVVIGGIMLFLGI